MTTKTVIEKSFDQRFRKLDRTEKMVTNMTIMNILDYARSGNVPVKPKKSSKKSIGLELEFESDNYLPKDSIYGDSKGVWAYTNDGSLRGYDNAEYILSRPIDFDQVESSVQCIYDLIKNHKSKVTDSHRTSVHVHFNVLNWRLNQVAAFFVYYFIVEAILADWNGESRVGNHFCFRAKDTPRVASRVAEILRYPTHEITRTSQGLKYGGINPWSISNLGSVEVRLGRVYKEPEPVVQWVSILNRIYEACKDDNINPSQICSDMSSEGATGFLQNLFKGDFNALVESLTVTPAQIEEMVYEGVRIAQPVAYARDWEEDQRMRGKFRPDFFGRSEPGAMPDSDLYPVSADEGVLIGSEGFTYYSVDYETALDIMSSSTPIYPPQTYTVSANELLEPTSESETTL